ncbi:hypothetical protein QTP70_005397 [Hemibagrus guttatus]|uniref:ribonuclease H n=1 Tax=Hemibagrus guttatus TaxID=175788 RepID=A0AAE0QAH8_9TELE|nr:hypothetical protein QTP70_005397 [Hemibagrus guttatus]
MFWRVGSRAFERGEMLRELPVCHIQMSYPAEVIRETGRKVLGVSSGRRKEDKETWWWNEEVQDSIQRKRLAKKKWDMDRTEENRQEYKELQRKVKREVSKAKQNAYDELYTRLDTREGEKDLYRLARQRDRDGKDVQQVRVIKDRDGRVLTSEESVQRRWKEYFEELMNEENEREKRVEGVNSVEQKVDKIRKDEVRKALKRMKSGKAVGPDDIPVEVWKCLGEAAVEFLASLFNRVLENLEKAYDRVPREELWYCMRKSGVAEKYVRVVQDMYERSRTVVRCAVGQTEEFKVEVGLYQGSALSPFLFAIVTDQLSEEVRQESPWTMMFADDIVICSESREQVQENLERWRFALERRGMKVSRIQSNGECGKEKISARIKGKVYRTVVRPAIWFRDSVTEEETGVRARDLNPMKHLWNALDKQVRSMEASPHNLQDLKDLLLTSWCQIPQHTFRDLVESMPRWVRAALAAKGCDEETCFLMIHNGFYGPCSAVLIFLPVFNSFLSAYSIAKARCAYRMHIVQPIHTAHIASMGMRKVNQYPGLKYLADWNRFSSWIQPCHQTSPVIQPLLMQRILKMLHYMEGRQDVNK